MLTINEKQRIQQVSDLLYKASRSVRILSHLAWPLSIREQFFKNKARELPVVSYPQVDMSVTFDALDAAKKRLGDSQIDQWLLRQAEVLGTSAKMLQACGSKDFFKYSSDIYGAPKTILPDKKNTPLSLALSFDSIFDSLGTLDLGEPPDACFLAETVAEAIRKATFSMFAEQAPNVQIVDRLSANALAGSRRIRIRKTACFSDKDIAQLIHHEVHIHVATSFNGKAQKQLKILGASHAGTTKTQEGLAVFSEFITGSMDIDRLRRLSDRVIAIQQAIDGADFIDIYRFFLDNAANEEQAFENARRVFRGGVLSGGAPFTKDIVYLEGLLRVHNFLRAIVANGRADCLKLLFCGKLDIEDLPVIHQLSSAGLCVAPQYLPPWAVDTRFLLSYLAYSSFLNGIDFGEVKSHYQKMLERLPASD